MSQVFKALWQKKKNPLAVLLWLSEVAVRGRWPEPVSTHSPERSDPPFLLQPNLNKRKKILNARTGDEGRREVFHDPHNDANKPCWG